MTASKRSKLTGEALEQLQQGVSLVFSRWTILQDAVKHGFGGPHSRTKVVSLLEKVLQFLCQPKSNGKEPLYIDDLEDLLDDGMVSLNVGGANADVMEVAKILMNVHEECLEGNYQSIQKLREVRPAPNVVQASMDGSDDYDDNDEVNVADRTMTIDSRANNEAATEDMEVDGWVTVSRKKSKVRKR